MIEDKAGRDPARMARMREEIIKLSKTPLKTSAVTAAGTQAQKRRRQMREDALKDGILIDFKDRV